MSLLHCITFYGLWYSSVYSVHFVSPIFAKRKHGSAMTQHEKAVKAQYYKSSLEGWMEI